MSNTVAGAGEVAQRQGVNRVAAAAIIVGGLAMALLFVPFTLAHGPTSFNEERLVLGLDMHGWGLALGLVPNVLIAAGLWLVRERITAGRRAPLSVLAIVSGSLLLDTLVNVAFGALGAPFVLFVLAPATLALAAIAPVPGRLGSRVLLAALGLGLSSGVALALVDQQTSDAVGGYRIFGIIVYGVGGILWALIGASLAVRNYGNTLVAT